jgi:hypothetical protein
MRDERGDRDERQQASDNCNDEHNSKITSHCVVCHRLCFNPTKTMPPSMRPLALTTTQLEAVTEAASCLRPSDRRRLLEAIAAELRGQFDIGDGTVAAAIRAALAGRERERAGWLSSPEN